MRPRIGVTSIRTLDGSRPVEQVNRAYCEAVRRARGLPLVLPVLDRNDAADVLAGLDGLLLTGGGDVAAWCFGQEARPEASGVDPDRDSWELALVAEAAAVGLPVLGICRGAQLLNVAAGGTLMQHLPLVTDHRHCIKEHDCQPVHNVVIDSSSRLAGIIGLRPAGVNSLHHQAVDLVAPGLRPVAWSPDGVVEAVESIDPPQLGVQWHPELLVGQVEQAQLFGWLVSASIERRDRQPVSIPVPVELLVAVA